MRYQLGRRAYFLIAALLLALSLLWAIALHYYQAIHRALPIDHRVIVDINPGLSITGLAKQLHQQGILPHPAHLIWLARLTGKARYLKAGEYAIQPNTTTQALLAQFVKGDIIYHRLTIIPGWSFHQLMAALNANPDLTHPASVFSQQQIMARLGYPHQLPEGQFYPETYTFAKGSSDIQLLTHAYQLMQQHLKAQWKNRASHLPYHNANEVLVVASIIEKETAVNSERPLIARVILNRLKKHMRLQVDPTVIYALGPHFNGNLTRANLQINSKYNTYRYAGLPPTPIALPGIDSIQAALHPAKGNLLYFVAKGDGTHHFSSVLSAHQRAVRKYQIHAK